MPDTDRTKKADGWKKPGVGPIVATALIAEVGDWTAFSSAAASPPGSGWCLEQTGGKERLRRISKQGNRYLRWLLVADAMAVIRYARQHGTKRLWPRSSDGASADQGRCRRARQQDRSHGLGHDGARRALPGGEVATGSRIETKTAAKQNELARA